MANQISHTFNAMMYGYVLHRHLYMVSMLGPKEALIRLSRARFFTHRSTSPFGLSPDFDIVGAFIGALDQVQYTKTFHTKFQAHLSQV